MIFVKGKRCSNSLDSILKLALSLVEGGLIETVETDMNKKEESKVREWENSFSTH